MLPPRAILARLGAGSTCCPDRSRTARRGTRPCGRRSTGATTCSARLSSDCCVGWRCSRAGWTLDAAEAMAAPRTRLPDAGPAPRPQALRPSTLLGLAVRWSTRAWSRRREQPDGEPRYSLLETIREYALERLGASAEEADVRRHHADVLPGAGRAGGQQGCTARSSFPGLTRLEAEHDNLRAALAWSQSAGAETDYGLRLASALAGFWEVRGYLTEGRRWLETGLAQAERTSPEVRAKAMAGAGWWRTARAIWGGRGSCWRRLPLSCGRSATSGASRSR